MTFCTTLPILAAVVFALALRAGADTTSADDPGVPDEHPFSFTTADFVAGSTYYYNSSKINPIKTPTTFNTLIRTIAHDSGLTEQVQIKDQGFLGDPTLATLNLDTTLGVQELWHRQNDTGGSQTLALDDFQVTSILFPKAASHFTLDASRTTELTSQPFSETYRSITDRDDLSWTFPLGPLESTAHVFSYDFSQHSPTGLDNFKYSQIGAGISTSGNLTDAQRVSFHDEYNDIRQTDALQRTTAFNNDLATASHEWQFGPDSKNSLTSSINYLDQSGFLTQQRLNLQEDLLLHHGERLESFYEYELLYTRYPAADTALNRLQGGLRYNPTKDLHFVGTVGGLTQVQAAAETNEFYTRLDGDYTHPDPLGQFTANVNLALSRQFSQAQTAADFVTSNMTFDQGQQIVLVHTGLQPNSVNVLNASGTRSYFAGFDYTVIYKANRAVIQRLPGGALAAGSTVQVDYTLNPQPANNTATDSAAGGLRYEFKQSFLSGVGVYGRYFVQRQSISTDVPGAFVADNVDDFNYGVDYRIWRLRFNAEHDEHHDELFPNHSNHFSVRYEDRISTDLRILLDATHVRSNFYDDKTHYETTAFTGTLEYRLGSHIHTDLTLEQINITGNATAPSHGWDEQLSLKYEKDLTTIQGGLRYSELTTQVLNTTNLYFFVGVQRRF